MRTNWYKKAVIYQIYPRSFCDKNGDGIGDIPGIISKLDYLKDLGINCIWLSPVYDSPQVDNGYDISNYYDIYPPFGSMNDMISLIKEAHIRHIKIIMDFVGNHTSDKHKWFLDILNNPNSEYKDYYIIKKGKKNGKKPPNNWTGFFGEGAWEKLPNTDEYYLHLFAKGQPDLNWENPALREEIKKILSFWLDLGVDGFRCDVINLISKDQRYKNAFPLIGLTGYKYYINGPRLHEYLHELFKDVYSKYDSMTVGETVFSNVDEAVKLVSPGREELEMIFNFDHTDTDNYLGIKYLPRKFSLVRLKKIVNKWQKGLFNKGWNSLFIENHDQRRSVGRFNTDDKEYREVSAKMLAASYFLLQGTPFIYQGQEIGMTNGEFKSLDEFKDVEIKNMMKIINKIPLFKKKLKNNAYEVSRDNARIPISWDNSKYGGFSSSNSWIKVHPRKDEINVKSALENKKSVFYYYQDLIKLRLNHEVVISGQYFDLLPKHKSLYIYERRLDNVSMIVMSNFSKKEVKHHLVKEKGLDNIVLSNYDEHSLDTLKPYENRVYLIKK